MKKVLLSLGLVAGLSGAAQAQGIRFGLKAGGSLTSLSGADAKDASYKLGFNGGPLVNFGINDMFSVQPEVLFSMKGARSSSNNDIKTTTNYIDIPVLAKIATGATGLFFELGPQVGFLVSGSLSDNNGNSVDVKDNYKAADFGYVGGVGFQTETGAMIGLRYNGGFTNVGKDATVGGVTYKAGEAKNSAFQLYIGYMFGGK